MPDAYSHRTIKNPGSERNAECGMRNWESIQFVFLPHSEFPIPHSGNRWLGPRTPSLREGPGSAAVPSASPDPVAGTGTRRRGPAVATRRVLTANRAGLQTATNDALLRRELF